MATARLSRRQTAYAEAAAAKAQRQKIMVIVGVILLALVLVYEVPHTLKLLRGSSTSTASATPTTQITTTTTPDTSALLKAIRRSTPVDPFSGGEPTGAEPGFGEVATPSGYRDPFGSSGVSVTQTPTAPPVAPPAQVLPSKIVIGSPGAGRVAVSGWILILASIPTAQGRTSATTVALKARNRGLTSVSILNSSNRTPLRGGYWVVYTGPYPSLGAVNSEATNVHSSGFGDAYIRQLIVYKAK